MNNSIMNQEYEKLDKWLSMPSASPQKIKQYEDHLELIMSTGDIIGNRQYKDLVIASELRYMTRRGYSANATASKLTESPANVLAIFSSVAMDKTHYNPQNPGLIGNVSAYAEYVQLMKNNPLLVVDKNEARTVFYQNKNYHDLIINVMKLYEGLEGFDHDKLKNSATQLIEATKIHARGPNIKTVFTQGVINSINQTSLSFYINTTNMEFEKVGSDICRPKPIFASKIHVEHLVLNFTTTLLDQAMAARLLTMVSNDLDEWLDKVKTRS